jgi:acetyltransferase
LTLFEQNEIYSVVDTTEGRASLEVSDHFTFPTCFWLTRWQLVDGTAVTLRPIRYEDQSMMYEFHRSLSANTVRLRYFGFREVESRVSDEHLLRTCDNAQITLVAERNSLNGSGHQIIGVGHLMKVPPADEGELAIVVSDEWQGKGLGTKLLYELLKIGRAEDLERLFGYILCENCAMRHICRKLGFAMEYSAATDAIEAAITLRRYPKSCP